MNPFHLAIPVRDIPEARKFYGGVLGCPEGRSSSNWVDFDLYGHQLVCHLDTSKKDRLNIHAVNAVDGHDIPVPHFGIVLGMNEWHQLANFLQTQSIQFIVEPHIRFQGKTGEQGTMFFLDPSGNALEFKGFKDLGRLFNKD